MENESFLDVELVLRADLLKIFLRENPEFSLVGLPGDLLAVLDLPFCCVARYAPSILYILVIMSSILYWLREFKAKRALFI